MIVSPTPMKNSFTHRYVLCIAILGVIFVDLAFSAPIPKLSGHAERSSPQDLEVYSLKDDGTPGPSTFYSYEDFLKLPQVTVKRESDRQTKLPATYTGVYLSVLATALGIDPTNQVMGFLCTDHYKQYYDADYMVKHQPILLLKFDGKPPEQWPPSEHNTPLGPYYIVHQKFKPMESVDGYTEDERIPFGVVTLEISKPEQSLGKFSPPAGSSLDVMNGYKIAMGDCISCHNQDSAGGTLSQRPMAVIEAFAISNKDYFNAYVVNPQKFKPKVAMPPHPTFDDKTLADLRAYFKAMMAAAMNSN